MTATKPVDKERGHTLLLRSEMDKLVQAYLTTPRTNCAVVNTAITWLVLKAL